MSNVAETSSKIHMYAMLFLSCLKLHALTTSVGLPATSILSALNDEPRTSIRIITPKHEQGAGHMAEGYARASGKPGVSFISTGYGLTNMITPIQDALSDGTPMIVFFERDGTHDPEEIDAVGITRSCTKWNVMVQSIDELPRRINEAFEIATSGRQGPVLVDLQGHTRRVVQKAIPVENRQSSLPRLTGLASLVSEQWTQSLVDSTLQTIAAMVNRARRPVIYAGQGIVLSKGGSKLLDEMANKCSIPVTTTLHGLGAFDEMDPKALHMLGMHGTAYANMAMQEADLIIALGARFDDRVTMNVSKFAPKAAAAERDKRRGGIIQFEITPKNINKVVQATEAVVGDVASNLKRLLPLLEPRSVDDSSRSEWFSMINQWKSRWPLSNYERTPGCIMPQTLISQLSELVSNRGMKDRTYISTGVGQHQMWAAQYYRWQHPRTMITSGSLGTMGYGLPAAIGAKLAQPDGLVIDIDGDASIAMTISELKTAARFGVDIKVIVLNNEEQGMVTQLQNIYYEDRYAHTHQVNPNFVHLSEAMGVQAKSIFKPDEVNQSLQWLIDSKGPALLEVVTDKKVPVLPTVPAGGGLHEFIVYDECKT